MAWQVGHRVEGACDRWVIRCIVLLALAVVSCGPSRAVVYVSPDFRGKDVQSGKTGFLLPERVDTSRVLEEFVAAFGGDPSVGEQLVLKTIRQYMTGKSPLKRKSSWDPWGSPLKFRDLSSVGIAEAVKDQIVVTTDERGMKSLDVKDAAALAAVLEGEGIEYLIVFPNLQFLRGAAKDVMIPTNSGTIFVPGGGDKEAILRSQVFVWAAQSRQVVWNGFVRGEDRISYGFTDGTVAITAEDLVYDLVAAIR